MRKTTQKLGVTFLSATMLLSAAPGVANAATLNTQTAIGKYVQAHQGDLGNPVTDEQKFANGASVQEFEHGLVTYSQRTGTRTLTNAQEIQAFKNAGGVEKFGALESGSWNNTFCGQSVTTFDGKTRWMVVVDAKTQPSSSVDLNSAEGNQWKNDRVKTNACFPDNAPVVDQPTEPTDPAQPENLVANLDWSKATYVQYKNALLLQTDTTAYVTAADANGVRVANAPVYEVEWLKTSEDARDLWDGVENRNTSYTVLGKPTAPAVWDGNTSTQTFENGTITYTRGSERPTISLTVDGAYKLEAGALWGSSDGYNVKPTGALEPLGDRFLIEKNIGDQVFVYDTVAETAAWMDNRVFAEFEKDTEQFGTVGYSVSVGGGRGGPEYNYTITYFTAADGSETQVVGLLSNSVGVYPTNGEKYTIDNEPKQELTDPANVDWSRALFIERQQALYFQDGESALIIAANPDGTPKAGAQAYRSDWIGYQLTRIGRFDWNSASEWAYGDYMFNTGTKATALGLPIADSQIIEEDGVKYYTQDFQGGNIKIEVKDRMLELDSTQGEITLNDWGKAKLAEYEAEFKAQYGN